MGRCSLATAQTRGATGATPRAGLRPASPHPMTPIPEERA
jgi:hypothetical protein